MPKLFPHAFARDRHRCVYCGKYMLQDLDTFESAEVDHLKPRSLGGEEILENVVIACRTCNSIKGSYAPKDITLSPSTREQYIQDIRRYIMEGRAKKLGSYFLWWAQGHGDSKYYLPKLANSSLHIEPIE